MLKVRKHPSILKIAWHRDITQGLLTTTSFSFSFCFDFCTPSFSFPVFRALFYACFLSISTPFRSHPLHIGLLYAVGERNTTKGILSFPFVRMHRVYTCWLSIIPSPLRRYSFMHIVRVMQMHILLPLFACTHNDAQDTPFFPCIDYS